MARQKIRNIDVFVKAQVKSLKDLNPLPKHVGDARFVKDLGKNYIFTGDRWEPFPEYVRWLKEQGFSGR